MYQNKESVGLLAANDQQQQQNSNKNNNNQPQQQEQQQNENTNEQKESSKESLNKTNCTFSHTVKEAVAIAAGKKESGNDDDDGKNIKSNMLCYLYWLLVVLILGLISFTVWLSIQLARRHNDMNAFTLRNTDHRKTFEFEDIFNSSFHLKNFKSFWINDDVLVYRSPPNGHLYLHNTTNNITEKWADSSIFEQFKADDYRVSPNLRFILIKYQTTKLWKNSFLAKYVLFDRHYKSGKRRIFYLKPENEEKKDEKINEENENSEQEIDYVEEGERPFLQSADFSPSSSSFVFVMNNDLYYQSSPKLKSIRLTKTGKEGEIFNGVSDWSYESIFSTAEAYWWSPDSKFLCYLSINDSKVPKFKTVKRDQNKNGKVWVIPHPTAFPKSEIPKVTLKVIDLSRAPYEEEDYLILPQPIELKNKEFYVSFVSWKDSKALVVVWMNRAQNRSYTTLYNINNPTPHNIHYQISTDGWVEPIKQFIYIENYFSFLSILPGLQADGSFYNHLALIKPRESRESEVKFLTSGLSEVTFIASFDPYDDLIYYISTNGDPKSRHLFKIHIEELVPKCLTCHNKTHSHNLSCDFADVSFSSKSSNFVLGCLGKRIPAFFLVNLKNYSVFILENNTELQMSLKGKILPNRKFLEVPVANNLKAWTEVIEPQEEGSKKFPLVIFAQNEPGTQLVTYKFSLDWVTFLASREEFVVARVDGRGAGGRGRSYRQSVFGKLTVADVEDLQLAAITLKSHDMVDPAKVALVGWGHSGLLALHALANESDIFPCGLVGGVLGDLDYYDAVTFEKYLGFSDNQQGLLNYMKTDILKKISLMRTKKLALAEGLKDDHIRSASTDSLMEVLVDNDILFRYHSYTDLNNYDVQPKSRHLFHWMREFLKQDCFSYFWKHDTKSWILDKNSKKDKFRIKQFCV